MGTWVPWIPCPHLLRAGTPSEQMPAQWETGATRPSGAGTLQADDTCRTKALRRVWSWEQEERPVRLKCSKLGNSEVTEEGKGQWCSNLGCIRITASRAAYTDSCPPPHPPPESESVALRRDPRICISDKFQVILLVRDPHFEEHWYEALWGLVRSSVTFYVWWNAIGGF